MAATLMENMLWLYCEGTFWCLVTSLRGHHLHNVYPEPDISSVENWYFSDRNLHNIQGWVVSKRYESWVYEEEEEKKDPEITSVSKLGECDQSKGPPLVLVERNRDKRRELVRLTYWNPSRPPSLPPHPIVEYIPTFDLHSVYCRKGFSIDSFKSNLSREKQCISYIWGALSVKRSPRFAY